MTRGARSANLWGTRFSKTCGGSTMWSSAEMTVYFLSAFGGSGRKVTVRSPARPPLVKLRFDVRSSIEITHVPSGNQVDDREEAFAHNSTSGSRRSSWRTAPAKY